MLVGAVAGIDHRDVAHLAGIAGRALQRMPHHNDIHVVGYHLDGVLEALALADAGVGHIAEAYYSGAQAVGGSLEAEAGPGGGLEEQAGDDLALQQLLAAGSLHLTGHREYVQDFFLGEITYRNQTFWHIDIFCIDSKKAASQPSRTLVSRVHLLPKSGTSTGRRKSLRHFITEFICE